MSAEDLADALDCSPKRVRSAVAELIGKGGLLTENAQRQYELTAAFASEPGNTEVVGTSDYWTHRIGITSDNHLCNRHSRLDVLNDAYDFFWTNGITRVFNAGNWIDGEHKFTRTECIVAPAWITSSTT